MTSPASAPERRLNLLTGDWVLVSSHRMNRPWQGAQEQATSQRSVKHDPACYLCPGVARAGGVQNPVYEGVYVFDNDFPALLPGMETDENADPVFVRQTENGICRVICYSPDHSRTMAHMTAAEITPVVDVWAEQYAMLAERDDITAVTIFENRGAMMGASNPHPHGQIWATGHVPNELAREDAHQKAWLSKNGEALLTSYLVRELEDQSRLVLTNDSFVALVPYWAAWPFETLVLPRRQVTSLDELSHGERLDLADVLQRLTACYDQLFQAPFPYTMGFHQAPCNGQPSDHFTLHAHFYPPLLRSSSIRKFMVGFEMLAMPQRDLTAEAAAERLRAAL
ncbi:MAG: UDP-glucose--hexose-1-phosphate uridylyltransferase [Rhizobiales bacterium]|nr:UDP-glucose--hexose-1-phosphate uridylyltransferase [Hyphomicrobiales bacterium]